MRRAAVALAATWAIAQFEHSAMAQEVADRIFTGGPVLTMNDLHPRAEAVAVKDGKIVAVGSVREVMEYSGDVTEITDLAGRALIPGFVDAHGHVMMGGMQALSANLLAPPDGGVTDIASLQRTLRDWMGANEDIVRDVNLVVGFGYDNAQLAELRHPTRDDLDAVSKEVPIIIVHQSGHLGAMNSRALEIAGITSETVAPAGGVIRHDANGEPDGVLEENAFMLALPKLLGNIDRDGFKAMAVAGADLWARYGYTTADEGRATPATAAILQEAGKEGLFKIDIAIYPDVLIDRDWIKANVSDDYKGRVRVAGAKLTIDGSPQGFTALRDRPYYEPVGSYPPGYRGYASANDAQVLDAVDWAYANGLQILTHANGEGASDTLIAAIGAAETAHENAGDLRPVLIHGQFLREDQVDSIKALRIFPSLFPMHTFYWGDWHREHTVGPVNADNISPTGWLVERDMIFSSHHDAPVAFPDSMRVLDATVTRRTRSGDILGPAQRVDVVTALKAMTIWPAWSHHEADKKGSIEVGKLADLVVLSGDPTAIDPESIDTLRVDLTIKEGETIFDRASVKEGALQYAPKGDGDDPYAEFLRIATVENEAARSWPRVPRPAVVSGPHSGACVAGFLYRTADAALSLEDPLD